MNDYLEKIQWTPEGLVPAIAQDCDTGEILMMAWMNAESLSLTIDEGCAVYWSRSRNKLWRKGETSGHIQKIKAIHLDCDSDALLLSVKQIGGIACHTGRKSCFYQLYNDKQWQDDAPVIKNPNEIY